MDEMHRYTDETEALSQAIVAYARDRIADPQPLDGSATGDELTRRAGATITPTGIGGEEALRVWSEVLAPATISTDHPSSMAFVPGAPTKAAVLFDLIVGASSTIAAGWIDGAGAIWAENQALRWLADLAGFPADAGGAFVSGGSAGNLSALVAARARAAERLGGRPAGGWSIAVAESVHASVVTAARVIDVGVVGVPADERGRLTGDALAATLGRLGPDEGRSVFAVVASAGATNAGTVDDLAGIGEACVDRGIWFHVDAAYGGAGLVAPSVRERYRGIERADSFIIDPHKWLFAPYDCCALVYRDPSTAHGVFRQEAGYLDTVNQPGVAWSEWNPADYAYHLSRRARGLPLWFSLATYGTDAYRDAVERVLALTRETAEEIRKRDRARARDGSRALRRAVPPTRMGRPGLRDVVAPPARRTGCVRATDVVEGRAARPPLLREPADHDRPRADGARRDDAWTLELLGEVVGFSERSDQCELGLGVVDVTFLLEEAPCEELPGGIVAFLERDRDAAPQELEGTMLAVEGDAELLGHRLPDRHGPQALHVWHAVEEQDPVDDRFGVTHLLHRDLAVLGRQARVAPVLAHPRMHEVLVDDGELEREELVQRFDDPLASLHVFPRSLTARLPAPAGSSFPSFSSRQSSSTHPPHTDPAPLQSASSSSVRTPSATA